MDPFDDFEIAPIRVAVDTREQAPFQFNTIKTSAGHPLIVATETKTLKSGDYSVCGLEQYVSLERKSHEDLYATLSSGRDRFVRELERLDAMVRDYRCQGKHAYAAVVVEAGFGRVSTTAPPRSRVRPESIIGSIEAFAQRYLVQWWFYPTRQIAEERSYKLLLRFFNDFQERQNGAADPQLRDAG
jgi:DNA excision repair protein ERCC-4